MSVADIKNFPSTVMKEGQMIELTPLGFNQSVLKRVAFLIGKDLLQKPSWWEQAPDCLCGQCWNFVGPRRGDLPHYDFMDKHDRNAFAVRYLEKILLASNIDISIGQPNHYGGGGVCLTEASSRNKIIVRGWNQFDSYVGGILWLHDHRAKDLKYALELTRPSVGEIE